MTPTDDVPLDVLAGLSSVQPLQAAMDAA